MTEHNVYAPPKSDVTHSFYVVGKRKFFILMVATIGIYQVFWFYKNWYAYKGTTGESVLPVMRAIFSVFFVHALFRHVDAQIKRSGHVHKWNAGIAATTTVISLIAESVLSRLSDKGIGSPFTDIASFLALSAVIFNLSRAQDAINISCGDPTGQSNAEITGPNIAWIVIGAILWVFVLIGLFLPA